MDDQIPIKPMETKSHKRRCVSNNDVRNDGPRRSERLETKRRRLSLQYEDNVTGRKLILKDKKGRFSDFSVSSVADEDCHIVCETPNVAHSRKKLRSWSVPDDKLVHKKARFEPRRLLMFSNEIQESVVQDVLSDDDDNLFEENENPVMSGHAKDEDFSCISPISLGDKSFSGPANANITGHTLGSDYHESLCESFTNVLTTEKSEVERFTDNMKLMSVNIEDEYMGMLCLLKEVQRDTDSEKLAGKGVLEIEDKIRLRKSQMKVVVERIERLKIDLVKETHAWKAQAENTISKLRNEIEKLNKEVAKTEECIKELCIGFNDCASVISNLVVKRQQLFRHKDDIDSQVLQSRVNQYGKNDLEIKRDCVHVLMKESWNYSNGDPPKDEDNNFEYHDHVLTIAAMSDFLNLLAVNLLRFSEPVKGPLYSSVFVKQTAKPQVVSAIEEILDDYLLTFLVNNTADKEVLEELIVTSYGLDSGSSAIRRPTVEVFRFSPQSPKEYKFSRPVKGATTVTNVLLSEESDRDFLQFIVHVTGTDHLFLFESEHVAFAYLCEEESPKNMAEEIGPPLGYSLDGYKIFPFPNFKTTKFPIRSTPLYIRKANDEILKLEKESSMFKKRIETLNSGIDALRKEQLNDLTNSERCKLLLQQVLSTIKSKHRIVNQLENSLKLEFPVQVSDEEAKLKKYESECNNLKRQAELETQRIENFVVSRNSKLEEIKQRKESIRKSVSEFHERTAEFLLRYKHRQYKQLRKNFARDLSAYSTFIDDVVKDLQEVEDRITMLSKSL